MVNPARYALARLRSRCAAGLALLGLLGGALAPSPVLADPPVFAEDLSTSAPAPAPPVQARKPASGNSIGREDVEPPPPAGIQQVNHLQPVAEPLPALATPPAAPAAPIEPAPAASVGTNDLPAATAPVSGLMQVGCSRCAGGLFGIGANVPYEAMDGCEDCRSGQCHAGRQPCHPCLAHSFLGHLCCSLYECICCPDPCYEPRYLAVADAAFFTETARPVSTQRFRWDCAQNVTLMDRNEYFWARADGNGRGPSPPTPYKVEPRLRYNELSYYTEAASGNIGIITEIPYRAINPVEGPHTANFGDIMVGTRTLLFDCELLQITFLMKTFIPAGSTGKGLGTGHVSLEPSLVYGIKLGPETYFQGQFSQWIPLGGDQSYAGALIHQHYSLNQVLFRCLPDVPLIGTLELNTFHFQDGAYTDPLLGSLQKSSGETYVMPGCGIRLVFCDKFDIGIGAIFAVTERHLQDQLYRTEIRWRF